MMMECPRGIHRLIWFFFLINQVEESMKKVTCILAVINIFVNVMQNTFVHLEIKADEAELNAPTKPSIFVSFVNLAIAND